MSETNFPEGIRLFRPHEKAPNFVKGEVVIEKSKLIAWLNDQPEDKVKLTAKEAKNGNYYFEVNSWKPTNQTGSQANAETEEIAEDLPF